MKTMKYIIPTLFLTMILSACDIQIKKKDSGNNEPANNTTSTEVTKAKWEELFDLENIAFRSNFKISVDYPDNDWKSTMEIDNSKFYVTNTGYQNVPEGEDPPEQKNYRYYKMKSMSGSNLTYDEYKYWNQWTVQEYTEDITNFFRGYGIFHLNYADFKYDDKNSVYRGTLSEYEIEATVSFENNLIKRIVYSGKGQVMYYDFSNYGEISVEFPK